MATAWKVGRWQSRVSHKDCEDCTHLFTLCHTALTWKEEYVGGWNVLAINWAEGRGRQKRLRLREMQLNVHEEAQGTRQSKSCLKIECEPGPLPKFWFLLNYLYILPECCEWRIAETSFVPSLTHSKRKKQLKVKKIKPWNKSTT